MRVGYMLQNIPYQMRMGYGKFYDRIGTILMGCNTYKTIKGFDGPFPYAEKINYVFSRTKPEGTEYVNIR